MSPNVPMDREAWQRIKTIAADAWSCAPADRASFIAQAVEGDERLAAHVLGLVESMDRAADRFEAPRLSATAVEQARAALGADRLHLAGTRVGPWEIVRELGHGGMGTVYLVERVDAEFRQRGALKMARGFVGDALLGRFREERRILATLEYPDIARLIDGGTTEHGLPYVVMEYAEGVPIDVFCEINSLDVRQRVELFRRVCAAVHYAHQRLVIHRDLKASNILVAPDGTPKLLDFGIAKILEADAARESTSTLLQMLTPESASPEQIRGEPITTASDIYSLGVLLYRLLSGGSPYRASASRVDLMRAICEETPGAPSIRAKSVECDGSGARQPIDRDLDLIVLKALRKEPARRYGSAEQLSDDLRRFLTGHPVLAAPDSPRYRASKFVRRHRTSIGLSAAALAAIVAAGGVAIHQATVARAERAVAERRFNDVRHLANSVLFEFHDAIENLPGSTPARVLVVTKALQYLENLEREVAGDRALQREVAAAYERLGDVQGRPIFASLGRTGDAAASYRKALAIREALLAQDPTDVETQRALQSSDLAIGRILARNGDTEAAIDRYQRALVMGEALLRRNPKDDKAEASLARVCVYLGDALSRRGDADGAKRQFLRGLAIDEKQLAAQPDNELLLSNVSGDYDRIGYLSLRMGNADEALGNYQRALAINEKLAAKHPANFVYRRNLSLTYSRLGEAYVRRKDLTRGLDYQRRSLALREINYKADPANAQASRDLLVINDFIGHTLTVMGADAEALSHFRRQLEIAEARGKNDASAQVKFDIGTASRVVGRALVKLGNTGEGAAFHRRAVGIFEDLTRRDPANTEWQSELALAYSSTGEMHETLASRIRTDATLALAEWEAARSWYGRSLQIWRRLEQAGTLAGGSLGGDERTAIQEATRRAERCDAEIARLSRTSTAAAMAHNRKRSSH